MPPTTVPLPPPRPATAVLPLSHVVLFSSGVGYFQREGEIDGDARVDLTFPATDVNDLIKSLVLQDTGGGKVATINYDSQDPIEKTLKTFALDLTSNPTLGHLLNQARGEKVEVTLQQSTGGPGRHADRLDRRAWNHNGNRTARIRRSTSTCSTSSVPRACAASSWPTCCGCGSSTRRSTPNCTGLWK